MAIVANSSRTMTRFNPAAELRGHAMTIGTSIRIVGHIRVTFRVEKGISSDAYEKPNGYSKNDQKAAGHCSHRFTK